MSNENEPTLPQFPSPADLQIERFEILAILGKGGMGWVYRALDRETGDIVALKVLRPEYRNSEELIERFKNELRLARRVTHRNVCRIYELGRSDDLIYITMELVEGESLRSRLRSDSIGWEEAVDLLVQVCDGLSEAHRTEITHRDLKPENVMISSDGEVKILDFGLARSIDPGMTGSGQLLGTPAYMAPEQASGGEVGPATDVYALGLILYELLTGRRAIQGDSPVEIALRQVRETPPSPRKIVSSIPRELDSIVMRCLEKDPRRRFRDAGALGTALAKVRTEASSPASRARTSRRLWPAISGLIAIVAALIAIAVWLHSEQTSQWEPTIEHYRLDNGLQVVLAPDPGAHAVGVAVAYEAGSHTEPEGLEGITHFAEHMLFRGSENVARGEYHAAIDRVGGTKNGIATGDALVVHSVVPAEQLELALFLEADRMRSPRFEPDVVERERRVMLEEYNLRSQSPFEDVVRRLTEEVLAPNPERRGVMGTRESLLAITSSDLTSFAQTYLTPRRAAMAITGNFAPDTARELVERHFGSVPGATPAPEPPPVASRAEMGPDRITMASATIPSPLVIAGYRAPGRSDPDYLPLQVAIHALANREGSRLHRLLVEEHELALQTGGGIWFKFGRLEMAVIYVLLKEGKDPELVQELVERELRRISEKGLDTQEIERIARQQELERLTALTSPGTTALELAWKTVIHGNPRLPLDELPGLERLTSDQIAEAARKWLHAGSEVMLTASPGGEPAEVPPLPPALPALPDELPLNRIPIVDADISVSIPAARSLNLENGTVLLSVDDPSYPITDLSVRIEGAGPVFEPATSPGVARLTVEAVKLGAAGVENFDRALAASGCRLSAAAGPPYAASELRARGLSRLAGDWIPLVGQTIRGPELPTDGIGRSQERLVGRLQALRSDVEAIAQGHARRLVYDDHPAGRLLIPDALGELTPRDVADWYGERYRPERTLVVVRGPLENGVAKRAAEEEFASWTLPTPGAALEWPEPPSITPGSALILDGSPRGAIVIGAPAEALSDPRYPALEVLARCLSQRLWENVRDQQGLAYTVGATVDQRAYPGALLLRASTDMSSIPDVLDLVLREMDTLRRELVSAEELKMVGRAAAGQFAVSLREELPRYLLMQQAYGLSSGYWEAYPKKLQSVSAQEVRAAARQYLDPARLQLVLAGDAAALHPLLEVRGFDSVDVVEYPGY